MCVHVYENGVLLSRQELGSAVNSFINQDEFKAMKMLSGRRVLCCNKRQFCDNVMVSA